MPTPSNAPSSSTGGTEIQNPQLFAELTERQAMPQTSQPIKGLGKKQKLIVEKVGVVARARLLVKCTFKTAKEKPELNPGFPYKLLREVSLESNGVTGIIDCSAMTLEQRRRRVYRNPVSAILKAPKVGEKLAEESTFEAQFVVEVPIAHDMLSIIGALLAQNEQTSLSIDLSWADEDEIVSGGKITNFEGEVLWDTTVFSIGSTVQGKQEVTVLPDLSAFHGLVETETKIVGTGNLKANLIRTSGQLLCYTASILNGDTAEISPEAWTKFALEYGGNKDPLVWEPAMSLLEENADDYDGPLNIFGVHFLVIDNERDNPTRDMIIPESLTELRSVQGVAAGTEIKENARIVTTQETLYPAV